MIGWYVSALAGRHDPSACIRFTKDFLAAPSVEQASVVKLWDPELRWVLPSPWRLACEGDRPGTPVERILADLLFQALGSPYIDQRELLMGLAVVHNSCRLAGIDPLTIFEAIAKAVDGPAAQALRDFASRDAEDQSMEAFMLEAVVDSGGGYEIRARW